MEQCEDVTTIIGVSTSFLKVNTLNMIPLIQIDMYCCLLKWLLLYFGHTWYMFVCFTHLILLQCYLPLFLTPNEGSNTSKNLLILLYSLNKVGWKEANPVLNFPLKGKRRHASTNCSIHCNCSNQMTFFFFFLKKEKYLLSTSLHWSLPEE